MENDTIAAIATGMSRSGIGKIRMSGSQALEIADRVYRSPGGKKKLVNAESHTIHYGFIYDGDLLIDEVIVLIMKAPRSYTKEDTVEIDCHGGVVVMQKILETVIKYGARPAEPGEFTKRAFLNGRIDLSEAEAVIDVINAQNEYALSSSIRQLKGSVSDQIKKIRASILEDVAFIEAAIDDPEHISTDGFASTLKEHVESEIVDLQKLLDSANQGKFIKEGIQTVILGKPNVGKSSLLNILVGEERAIVTEIPGTTRDTLEESINLHGIPLNIIDTAGIRKTQDVVEKIGVEKAVQVAQKADLILYMVDSSLSLDENDFEIMHMIQDKKVIVLLNKTDLESITTKKMIEEYVSYPVIEISAKYGKGIDELESLIRDLFFNGRISFNDEVYITNVRHKTAIQEAVESLKLVLDSIQQGLPEDFYSIDLMDAYAKLGEIIGEAVGEDLVDKIFSDFCMGK